MAEKQKLKEETISRGVRCWLTLEPESWVLSEGGGLARGRSWPTSDVVVVRWPSRVRPCDSMDCSMSGFPVLHHLLDFALTHIHWVGDTIQPSNLLSPPSPPALNLSQHQGLFQWVSSSYQVAKLLELQLQCQSFQWIFRIDFPWDWLVCSYSPKDSQ